MSQLRKLSIKILALLIDIFLLSYKLMKQLVLPNRKRKGNILSSLFIFFIGILERLHHFEHGFFNMAALFKQKYIKQSLIIAGALLFMLSLFEWTGNSGFTINKINLNNTEQIASIVEKRIIHYQSVHAIGYAENAESIEAYNAYKSIVPFTITSTSPIKWYLFICSLRI